MNVVDPVMCYKLHWIRNLECYVHQLVVSFLNCQKCFVEDIIACATFTTNLSNVLAIEMKGISSASDARPNCIFLPLFRGGSCTML